MILITKSKWIFLPLLSFFCADLKGQNTATEFYEIKTYRIKNNLQEKQVHAYLAYDYLPTAHRFGIKKIGIFVPIETDSMDHKQIVIFTPYLSLEQFSQFKELLMSQKRASRQS